MRGKDPEAKFDLGGQLFPSDVHHYSHGAMATLFEIYCVHPDAKYAGQAAQAAFDLVGRLELELSRFIENSDISRINSLGPGQYTAVSPWTLECLQTARNMYLETGRAFDISLGSGFETLEFVPDDMTVHASAAGVRLDLGGIGKGFAVDRMAELLEEWDIPRALLHGGFSSVLALESPVGRDGWPLTLSLPGPGNNAILARVSARQRALSASGLQKGNHIVDPRDGQPVRDRLAAWVSLPRSAAQPLDGAMFANSGQTSHSPAAVADALSTAFMILSTREVADCCERREGLEVWLVSEHRENESGRPVFLHLPDP